MVGEPEAGREGSPFSAEEPAPQGAQGRVLGALRALEPRLGDLYLGAILALRDRTNPVRFAQSAHVLREILDAVLEAASADAGTQPSSMGEKLRPLAEAWKRICPGSTQQTPVQREMDGDTAAFLSEAQEFFAWRERDRKERRSQMQQAVRALDVSRRGLPTVLEKKVVRDGMDLRQYFIKVCHFEVKADEATFLARLDQMERFLMARLRPRPFADQEALDALLSAAGEDLSDVLVERAEQLMKRGVVNYEHFFSKIDSAAWIEPLSQREFFTGPPSPVVDAEGIRVPGWLPSEYLARVASLAPSEVAEVILSINTDNERVHRDFAQAACAMPGPLAVKVTQRERKWLAQQSHLYFGLSQELAKLVCHLVECGELDSALKLAGTLLVLKEPPEDAEIVIKKWRGRESDWTFGEVLRAVVPVLLTARPVEMLERLVRLLRLIADSSAHAGSGWAGDAFRAGRPRLDADDRLDRDVEQALLSALRDASRRAFLERLVTEEELLDILGPESGRLFHRLACQALCSPPAASLTSLKRVLLLEEAFFESEPSPEYRALLAESFPGLPEEDQAVILSWIEAGPSDRPDRLKRPGDGSELLRWEASWRIRRLALVRDHLPADWRSHYDALVAEHGDKQFGTSFEIHTWSGPQSPMSLEELEALGDAELLGLIRNYEGGDGWFGPSRDGLARTFSALAEKDPARLSRLAAQLADVLPVYIHWLFVGLESVLRKRQSVDWDGLTELFEAVVERKDEAPFDVDCDETVGRWTWARKSIADLLALAFAGSDVEAPYRLRSRLWAVLEQLTADEEPDAEYEREYGSGVSDPGTTALNTVRGRALEAVVGYATWVKRHAEAEHGGEISLLEEAPEAVGVLEAHLDPAFDSAQSVRSVYGERFPWLVLIGEEWARELVPRVFPRDAGAEELRAAAWERYLVSTTPYESCFRVLEEEYLAASHEPENASRWEWRSSPRAVRVALGVHLVAFYLRGLITFEEEGGHLEALFANTSPVTRGEVLTDIGRFFSSWAEADRGVAERLMALWEWRLRETVGGGEEERLAELGAFSWWLPCKGLPAEWRLAQLETLLENPAVMQPGLHVYEFLATVAESWPLRVVAALRALIDAGVGTWPGLVGGEHIHAALEVCLASGDAAARAKADELVQLLGAKGFGEFRDLA